MILIFEGIVAFLETPNGQPVCEYQACFGGGWAKYIHSQQVEVHFDNKSDVIADAKQLAADRGLTLEVQ